MEDAQWKYLLLLKAITEAQIDVAAMQAENQSRQHQGLAQAYGESAFYEVADRLNGVWEVNRP